MNANILNFNRIGLLFRKYFTERMHSELILWGIIVLVFMFIRNAQIAICCAVVIGGMFYAGRLFRNIHLPTGGNTFFMLPASQLEKLIVGIVIGIFYYFGMVLIAYTAGNLLGTLFNNLLAQVPFFSDIINLFGHKELEWVLFRQQVIDSPFGLIPNHFLPFLFLLFIYNQSIYLLGSIYFKRNQVWKTLFSVNIISTLLLVLTVVEVICFKGNIRITPDNSTMYQLGLQWGKAVGNIGFTFLFYLMPPFLWIVSYFRLTEKQV